MKVASVPPEVSVPPEFGPSAARSQNQRTTWVSSTVSVGDISQTATDWLSAATTVSAHTAAGSGADTWWPTYIGWNSRLASAITSRRIRAAISASDCSPMGSGSTNRCASVSGSRRVDTGPVPSRVSAR